MEHYFRDVCGHLLYAGGSFRRGSVGIRNWVSWLGGQSELGAAALLKAVWWDLHLASLLTHLLAFVLFL